ncbi:purple acid phosphatase family protein [Phycisphaera mikurensis]|uniref:Putative hydrolase n=1 Tax=Phycisphaera mikurensis (strain NBRC 102666 / KCTC 22515 / FYK2301M01) TaxID=1142394 RepID=I0IAB9_PHYMF|nr:metallophosphoesterase family protein [Phycisphaera mikurensis]MBB6441794.1 hypothetical protein [Phycisphaera mikurensis]BAM02207.1 putative hydrolase [Phycisphaera mikurensis NBRC 102666]
MTGRLLLPVLLAVLLAVLLQASPADAKTRRGLTGTVVYATWTQDPTTTLTVHWIDDDPGDPADRGGGRSPTLTVRGIDGTEGADAGVSVTAATMLPIPGTSRFVHRAEATGLAPGAAYAVRVPGDPRPRRFRTVDADPATPTRFVLTSDVYRRRDPLLAMHAHLAARDPAFVILAGDIAYANGDVENADRWLDFLWAWDDRVVTAEGFSVPMIALIGNHEVDGGYLHEIDRDRYPDPADASPFFRRLFAFPGERSYGVLDFGDDLSLVALDSGHQAAIAGEQTRWLEETLAARQHRTHLFTAWHVPAYPSARRLASSMPRRLRRHFVPLLDRYGVDASFEGHDHAYKRTQPIRHGKIDPLGTVYVGDGGYADLAERVPAEPGRGGWFSDARWYLANSKQTDHFEVVTLTGPDRRFEAVGADGEVFDAWESHGNEPKAVVETPVTPVPARAEFWLLLIGVPAAVGAGAWWTRLTRSRRRAAAAAA